MTRNPSRRRARRNVYCGLAVFVALTVGLNVLLDTVRPQWRDPEFGHRLTELKPLAESRRPVIVALGSSRTQMGLAPQHLGLGDGPDAPLVYNFSQAGCGPMHEKVNLDRLLANGVTPDVVLVEILPPVLGGNSPGEKLFLPFRLGVADLGRVSPYCIDPTPVYRGWAETRLNPWYTLRLNLLCHFGAGSMLPWQARQDFMWKQMQGLGWLPYFFTESQMSPGRRDNGLAQARGQYVPYFHNFHIAPLPDRAYRELIATCQAHGIRVGFYVMPESPTFRSWYPPEVRAKLDAYYADLRGDFGVPVTDCSDWLNDDALFADGHHLMRHGAVKFSERFGPECVRPWLIATPP